MNIASEVATPKKILIVRLGAMGDIIHALPAVGWLRHRFPSAKFGWVIENRWSGLLRADADAYLPGKPKFDSIHEVDTRAWRKQPISGNTWGAVLRAFRELRNEHYEMTVDFQGSIKSSLIAALSGAPKRFGFAMTWEKPASLLYTHTVITTTRHVVEQNLELAEAVTHRKSPPVQSSADREHDEETWSDRELRKLGLTSRFAILNPGAGWGAKQWPPSRYGEVARQLGSQGIRSLINYGPGEEGLARDVESGSAGHAIAVSFSISELMAIASNAALFIGGDTGPMHLAALFQVPVVAIFGPTDPARNGPYGTKSIVLRDPTSITSHKRNRDAEAGLLNITTGQVLKAARELLAKGEGERA